MKIIALAMDHKIYSSNAYLVLGSWNRLDDINTLVDTGNNPGILEQISGINTGVGKRAVEQIVLTHSHFDHKGLLERLADIYNPSVCAFAPFEGVSRTLKNNHLLRMGDRSFEVIHTPGHSNDSLCFYCAEEGVLFSGDMPLHIMTTEGTYVPEYVEALARIASLKISIIYPGHGKPITENPLDILRETLKNVRESVSRQTDSGT
ncbi:MAG: MBL fold metallo-hydrolase [Candidatus Xenobiia bacterium LiM19]